LFLSRPTPDTHHEKPTNSFWSWVLSLLCTGVSVGCSDVNSESKLETSVAEPCRNAVPPSHQHLVTSIETTKKTKTHNLGKVWRRDSLGEHVLPAHVLEKRLLLNFLGIRHARTQSSLRVAREELHRGITVLRLYTRVPHKPDPKRTFCKIATESRGM
jgi:hypothetical protein